MSKLRTHWMRWLLAVMLLAPVVASGCANEVVPPTAKAAQTSQAMVGQTVTLDASPSTDPQDLSLSYNWSFRDIPAGSHAELNDPTLVRPSFVPDVPGTYVATLIVTNGVLASKPISVSVDVSACGSAAPTVSEIQFDPAQPGVATPIQLSATVDDADNADACGLSQTMSYHWSLAAVPTGSQAMIAHPTLEKPTLKPDMAGTYVVSLVVTDSTGRASEAAQTSIDVSACGTNAPALSNLAATPTQPAVGQAVKLTVDAADADNDSGCDLGQTVSYQWALADSPAGSQATLNNATATSPSFAPDMPGDYVIEVQATDSTGLSSDVATMTVSASDCGANAPDAGAITATPSAGAIGQPVQLSATPTDADNADGCGLGQTMTLHWSMVALPAGSQAQLNQPSARNPSFVPDRPGDYTVALVVTDSTGLSSAASEVTVNVSSCGIVAPSIASVTANPASTPVGQAVQLSASVSDADNQAPCNMNQTLNYRWTLVGLPAGSAAHLNGAAATQPSLVPDVAGDYTIELVVTDSNGMSSAPKFVTVTANDCGAANPMALVDELYPDASAGSAATVSGPDVPVRSLVQMSGEASYDADNNGTCNAGQQLSYTWAMLALPAGSNASLNDAHVMNPWFRPDVAGTYVVELHVTDDTGRTSDRATFTITATPLVGVQTRNGFTTSTVLTGAMLDGPMGVTGDGNGNLYVAQYDGNSVLEIGPSGSVNTLATGGMIDRPVGVAYDPATGDVFVSTNRNRNNNVSRIVRVSSNGAQNDCIGQWWTEFGDITFYSGTQGVRLVAAANIRNNPDAVLFIDPSNCQIDHTNTFNDNLDNPWGVAAATINGTDTVAATDRGPTVWRNTDGVYGNNGNTSRVTDRVFEPRGVVYTPCASNAKLIVADSAGGTVTAYDNCGGGNCGAQTLVSGLDQPTGVYFDNNGDLIVTDPGKQAIFKVSGNFCGL